MYFELPDHGHCETCNRLARTIIRDYELIGAFTDRSIAPDGRFGYAFAYGPRMRTLPNGDIVHDIRWACDAHRRPGKKYYFGTNIEVGAKVDMNRVKILGSRPWSPSANRDQS